MAEDPTPVTRNESASTACNNQARWHIIKEVDGFKLPRFRKLAETCLWGLVESELPRVRDYATNRLAWLLYAHVDWIGDGQRDIADWVFAKRYISSQAPLNLYTEKMIVLCTGLALPKDVAELLSDPNPVSLTPDNQIVRTEGVGEDVKAWASYKYQLSRLSDERLIPSLYKGRDLMTNENIHFCLGRDIWELYKGIPLSEFPAEYGEKRLVKIV